MARIRSRGMAMKFIIVFVLLLVANPAQAQSKINVFACEPEWGALAYEIGGAAVDVYTASSAAQNVHFLRAKPSLLAAMRKADLVFCNGASLEVGWLPILLQKAGGPNVQRGKPGYLLAADQVKKLDVPVNVDRSMGDVHPEGNPHVLLDPRNILDVAGVLADRLTVIDPQNAEIYRQNFSRFRDRWQGAMAVWKQQASGLKGMRVVVYHTSWAYLLNWLGMSAVASLEPKPGIPPTASHLESVLSSVRGGDVKAILVAPFEDPKAAEWLSGKTGIPIIYLPFTVGGNDKADSLEHMFTETIRLLRGEAP